MVMREIVGSFVTPTARLSMLKPRLAKSPEMRDKTPAWFSTRMDMVYFIESLLSRLKRGFFRAYRTFKQVRLGGSKHLAYSFVDILITRNAARTYGVAFRKLYKVGISV